MARQKTCKICRERFTPDKPMQAVCGVPCAIQQSRRAAERRQKAAQAKTRKDLAQRKAKLKTRSQWLREAQAAFNAFVRVRDHGKPCISCGTYEQERYTGGHFDCGHYRSVGAASHLRFNLFNVAGQCKRCNRDLSGNVVEYRKGLVARIGSERVSWLEWDNDPRTFDIGYLRRLKRILTKRAKLYKRLKGLA